MTRAVDAALATITDRPADAAAVALCREYARLIDNAAPASKYRKALSKVAALAARFDTDTDTAAALDTVAVALAEHSVASDLGPKLLAALTALGLTAAGRTTGKDQPSDGPPRSPLDELRQRRARKRAAADMDAAAP